MPSRVLLTMASSEDSTIAARWARARSAAREGFHQRPVEGRISSESAPPLDRRHAAEIAIGTPAHGHASAVCG